MRKSLRALIILAVVAVSVVTLTAMVSAATLALDSSSEFFGQRGGGISEGSTHGTPDFGHPVSGTEHAVDLYGEGTASITLSTGDVVEETLGHEMQLDFLNGDTEVEFYLHSWLETSGDCQSSVNISITNNHWNNTSYSNMAAKTNLLVVGNPGESVKVHISSGADSDRSGAFTTSTSIGAPFPDNFSIWLNDVKVYDAGGPIMDPNGQLLDDFVVNAVAGDIVSIRAAVDSTLGGTVIGTDFNNNYAETSFYTHVSLEQNPVPIPGAVWLLGSGLLGLVAVRRRKKHGE